VAELSTIARPYAQALFAAARAESRLAEVMAVAEALATVVVHPQVAQLIGDPKVSATQVFEVLSAIAKLPAWPTLANFLRTLIENGRLQALPEIARQVHELKSAADGVADCLIETAFPMSDAQVAELVARLTHKFGIRLQPTVRVDASLIGGVRVAVGDHVLDTSVRARLAEMRTALIAA